MIMAAEAEKLGESRRIIRLELLQALIAGVVVSLINSVVSYNQE